MFFNETLCFLMKKLMVFIEFHEKLWSTKTVTNS